MTSSALNFVGRHYRKFPFEHYNPNLSSIRWYRNMYLMFIRKIIIIIVNIGRLLKALRACTLAKCEVITLDKSGYLCCINFVCNCSDSWNRFYKHYVLQYNIILNKSHLVTDNSFTVGTSRRQTFPIGEWTTH